MRRWVSNFASRFGWGADAEAQREVDGPRTVVLAQDAGSLLSGKASVDIEAWLDGKAAQFHRDWVFARLGGFSRGEDAAALQVAAALLQPSEELWVEPFADDLYSATAMQVRTTRGVVVGYLESSAAQAASSHVEEGGMLRCFVHSVTLTEFNLPWSILLALFL